MTENSTPTTNSSPEESGWGDCPNGEISRMVKRVSQQRSLATAARLSVVAAMLLAGLGVWLFFPANPQLAATPDGDLQVGSICCSDVKKYAAAFRKGELDAATTARIRQHIAACPHCELHFRHATQKPQASAVRDHADRYVAVLGDAAFVPGR